MRKIAALILALSFISVSAQSQTLQEEYKKLQSYTYQDLEISGEKNARSVSDKTQEMLTTIENSVGLLTKGKEKASPELMKELVRVAVLTFENDPSLAAAEILTPLYKKDKKAVDEAIKFLPKKSAKELRDALKDSVREESEGNG